MTTEQLWEIKKFNVNLEWLKNSQVKEQKQNEELVSFKDAMWFLKRQRTWIQNRMVKEVDNQTNVFEKLVRDVDWVREGNRIMFKMESLKRIKYKVLTSIGNRYDGIDLNSITDKALNTPYSLT